MRCARCGGCCEKTMMELSEKDILRLIGLGFIREEILRYRQGRSGTIAERRR